MGDTPETLRDVSISLNRTGDVLLSLGEPQAARERYWESLALVRAIRTRVGDNPDTLRDLMVTLFRLAEVTATSDRTHAIESVREAYQLANTLVSHYPTIHQHHEDLRRTRRFAEKHGLGNAIQALEDPS